MGAGASLIAPPRGPFSISPPRSTIFWTLTINATAKGKLRARSSERCYDILSGCSIGDPSHALCRRASDGFVESHNLPGVSRI